jgi:photosystem II stability/assembly factor-like uncharacterized protein
MLPAYRLPAALLLALSLSSPLAAAPQWTALGPFGGYVDHLTVDPADARVLYSTCDIQGTFKSGDSGAHWLPVDPSSTLSSVAVDPSRHTTIYETVGVNQVRKSTDGGAHWTVSSRIVSPQEVTYEIAVDPAQPARVYLGTSNGVWRSLDGGTSWHPGRRPLPRGNAQVVRVVLAVARPVGTVFAATGAGLFKSMNGGDTWKLAGRGLPAGAVPSLTRGSGTGALWAYVVGKGIFLSTDGGNSWRSAIRQPEGVGNLMALAASPRAAGTAWVSTYRHGIYRTTDAGSHWTLVRPTPDTFVPSLAAGGSTVYASLALAGLDPGGVLASDDDGTTWQRRNRGLAAFDATTVAVDPRDPHTLWAATGPGGLYRSTAGGMIWDFPPQPPAASAPGNPPEVSAVAFSADGDALYVLSGQNLWKTEDAGATWSPAGPGTPPVPVFNLVTHPRDPGTLYVNSSTTLYATQDAGATWKEMKPPLTCSFGPMAAVASTPTTLFAGGSNKQAASQRLAPPPPCGTPHAALYRTPDGGDSWTEADTGLAAGSLSSLAVDPFDPRTLYAGTFSSFGMWKSTDAGDTWSRVELDLQSSPRIATSPVDGAIWVADGSQVLVSRDGGATWKSVGGPQSYIINRLLPDPANAHRLYTAGWGGVWVLDEAAP